MAYPPLEPEFIDAVIGTESSGNPNAVSPKGAQGLMQVMPETAKEIAAELGYETYDIMDPETNKIFGTHYLSKQIEKFGSPSLGLAAYNAGPGRVQQALQRAAELGRGSSFEDIQDLLPTETQNYVPKIMTQYASSSTTEPVDKKGSSVRIDPASVNMDAEGIYPPRNYRPLDKEVLERGRAEVMMSSEEDWGGDEDWEDTLSKAKQVQTQQAIQNARYSENLSQDQMGSIVDAGRPVRGAIQNLHTKTPEERAQIGGVLGASAGLAVNGLAGSMIGAGVGAVAARSAGLVQSEQYQLQKQNDALVSTLGTIGLINQNGTLTIDLPNGDVKDLMNVNGELPNTNPVYDEPFRTPFQTDKTNPFTARAEYIAEPLSLVMVGMLGNMFQSDADLKQAKNASNFFTNALVTNANTMDDVYVNARGIAEKLGISKADLLKFMKQNKKSFNAAKYPQYLSYIESIYAR